jgi:hypothetical protein
MPIKLNLKHSQVIEDNDFNKIKDILNIHAHCTDSLASCIIQDLIRNALVFFPESIEIYGVFVYPDLSTFDFLYFEHAEAMIFRMEYDNFFYINPPSVTTILQKYQ